MSHMPGKGNTRHGMYGTPEYVTWYGMLSRCRNKSIPSYKYYGGRGIRVCERWLKFENFYKDMGSRPEGKTLDRIDVDGDYTPENCRWATHEEQVNGRRNVHRITKDGVTRSAAQWSRITGIKIATLQYRKRQGWKDEDVLK